MTKGLVNDMSTEQLTQSINNIQKEVSEIKAKQEIGLKSQDENTNISVQIGKLTVKLENLTEQIKGQNERFDRVIDTFDSRLKNQGERIGEQSTIIKTQTLLLEKLTKRVDSLESHMDDIRTKGSKKLSFILDKVIYVAVGIAVMYVLYRFGFGG